MTKYVYRSVATAGRPEATTKRFKCKGRRGEYSDYVEATRDCTECPYCEYGQGHRWPDDYAKCTFPRSLDLYPGDRVVVTTRIKVEIIKKKEG